jgi:hypothetical protein
MGDAIARGRQLLGMALRRAGVGCVLCAFLAALPTTAVANAAAPITLADWMRTIFVTPDREVDQNKPAIPVPTPTPPTPAPQTSSEQVPPQNTAVRTQLPEAWLRKSWATPRKRHLRLVPPA